MIPLSRGKKNFSPPNVLVEKNFFYVVFFSLRGVEFFNDYIRFIRISDNFSTTLREKDQRFCSLSQSSKPVPGLFGYGFSLFARCGPLVPRERKKYIVHVIFFTCLCPYRYRCLCCTWLVWNHNPQRPGVGESFLGRGKSFFLQDAIISSGASCEGKKKFFFRSKIFLLTEPFL